MTRLRQTTTNFTAGEISPDLLARGDTEAYDNGARRLRNVTIQPTGGVTRRAGMRFMAALAGQARLIPFEFPQQSGGMIVLSNGRLDIYLNGVFLAFLTAPWTSAQLSQITWTQSSDQLLIMHPDVSPRRLVRVNATTYTLNEWAYTIDSNVSLQPYYKFSEPAVTITTSGTTGVVTALSSAPLFVAAHVGTRFRIGGREGIITLVTSPTTAAFSVIQTLISTAPTTNWQEQAFSAVRGYPVCACFHQERLVIGGSRDIPNRIWMSQPTDMWNFRAGTGLDYESIEFNIVSDQANSVRGLFSGRHLQVFTSGAEYMITGEPMTPSRVQVRRQTRIGSMITRYLPPVAVEGVAMFMARNGQELREFVYTDTEQAYESSDVSLLAKHMLLNPVDQAYDPRRRILYSVRGDGRIAALTINRREQVNAWTLFETSGTVQSIAVSGDDVYTVTQRGAQFQLERFDDTVSTDAAITLSSGTAQTAWSGFTHLNGSTVSVVADGVMRSNAVVTAGAITISPAALNLEVGLPFRHIIEPLPPSLSGDVTNGKAIRLVEASFRLRNTCSLRLDVGRGLRNIPLVAGQPAILPNTNPLSVGDISVSAFGWHTDMTKPLWMIDQEHPLPFTLLGVKTELKRND